MSSGVNMDAMRRGYDEQQRGGGEYLAFEKGETLLYIHPPCRDNDKHALTKGKNYVPVTVHYAVGKNNRMVVGLDAETNPIIEHPFVEKVLTKRKVHLTGKCPMKKALDSGKTFSDEEADESRPQTKYLWGFTPMGFRKKSSSDWQEHDKQGEPQVGMVGKQIFDGIMECFFDNGDISDPRAAVLVRVIKSGKGRQTKYEVKVDPDTSKSPRKLPKATRAAIAKSMAEDGDCDLFRVVGNMIKSPDEVVAIIKGVEVDEDVDDEDDGKGKAMKKGAKKGKRDDEDEELDDEEELDEDDDEDDEGDLDDDEDEDDDEPKGKKSKAKSKAKSKSKDDDDEDDEDEDDEDEDDEDEDDEDEDDEPKGKKSKAKSKSKSKSKDDDEDDEDDDEDEADDEDDEADDEDDEDEPKGKAKAKAKGKKGKKSDDEDDDLGLDDLDDALADLDDEDDDDEKPKKGKTAVKKKDKKGDDTKPAKSKDKDKAKGKEAKSKDKGKSAKKAKK